MYVTVVLRQLDNLVYQGDFGGAQGVSGDSSFGIVSVAQECYVGRDFHVPYPDGTWFKFWDLVSVYAYIMNEVKKPRKALIHCCVGASRSVVVSVGWLCFRYGLDFNTAVQEAQRRLGVGIPSGAHLDSVRYMCDVFNSPSGRWYLRWLKVQLEAGDADPAPGSDLDSAFGWRVDFLRQYGVRDVLVLGASSAELEYFSRYFNAVGVTLAIHSYIRARNKGLKIVFGDVLDDNVWTNLAHQGGVTPLREVYEDRFIKPSPTRALVAPTKGGNTQDPGETRPGGWEGGSQPNSFDAVVAFDVLEHTYNPWAVVGQVRRLLRDGGIFFVSVPTVYNAEATAPWHFVMPDKLGWERVLAWWDFEKEKDLSPPFTIDYRDYGIDIKAPDRLTAIYRKKPITKHQSYHDLMGIF